MPQLPTVIPSVITIENTGGIILSVKFSREIVFGHASSSIRLLVFCRCLFFLLLFSKVLAMEWGVTDDQYSDEWIPLVMPSERILLMNCVSYIDGMNLSIKRFNGVVPPPNSAIHSESTHSLRYTCYSIE